MHPMGVGERAYPSNSVAYCISGPHQSHHHSHQSHRTPNGWKCIDGSHTQTGWMYKICLEEKAKGTQHFGEIIY